MTHVCQRWRQSALENKALWRTIRLYRVTANPSRIASVFLERSRPLDITLEHDTASLSDTEEEELAVFYKNLSDSSERARITSLYLRGDYEETALLLLKKNLPRLVEVEISMKTFEDDGWFPDKVDEIISFIGGCSSTLRRLSLRDFIFPPFSYPNLTHLHLTDELLNYANEYVDLLDILEAASGTLQSLYLSNATPLDNTRDDIRPSSLRTSMPSLQYVEICPNTSSIVPCYPLLILHNLSFPFTTTIVWDVQGVEQCNPGEWDHLPPAEHLDRITDVVGFTKRDECYVLEDTKLFFDPCNTEMAPLDLTAEFSPNVKVLVIPLDCTRYLGRFSKWRNTLNRWDSLEMLFVAWYDSLVYILADLENPKKALVAGKTICPQLRTLVVFTDEVNISRKDERRPLSRKIKSKGLSPLRFLSGTTSMTRDRPHLDKTYTLRFVQGDVDGLSYSTHLHQ